MAPASICMRAITGDLWVLTWGRMLAGLSASPEPLIRQGYDPTVHVSDVSVAGTEKYEAPFG